MQNELYNNSQTTSENVSAVVFFSKAFVAARYILEINSVHVRRSSVGETRNLPLIPSFLPLIFSIILVSETCHLLFIICALVSKTRDLIVRVFKLLEVVLVFFAGGLLEVFLHHALDCSLGQLGVPSRLRWSLCAWLSRPGV